MDFVWGLFGRYGQGKTTVLDARWEYGEIISICELKVGYIKWMGAISTDRKLLCLPCACVLHFDGVPHWRVKSSGVGQSKSISALSAHSAVKGLNNCIVAQRMRITFCYISCSLSPWQRPENIQVIWRISFTPSPKQSQRSYRSFIL